MEQTGKNTKHLRYLMMSAEIMPYLLSCKKYESTLRGQGKVFSNKSNYSQCRFQKQLTLHLEATSMERKCIEEIQEQANAVASQESLLQIHNVGNLAYSVDSGIRIP